MSVVDTSLLAYYDMKENELDWILRKRVLYCIKSNPNISGREIAVLLDEDILNVRPRLTELRKSGEIRDNGTKIDPIKGRKRVLKWVSV